MFMPQRRIKPAEAASPEHLSSVSINSAETKEAIHSSFIQAAIFHLKSKRLEFNSTMT